MLFNKTETNENELTTLEREKAELSQKMSVLSAKARATEFMPEKTAYQTEKGEIYAKVMQIQDKIDNLKEKLSIAKLKTLLTETRHDVLLYINTNRVRITEDLNVEIQFSCGKHTLKIPVYEILRFQALVNSNEQLFEMWKTIINNKETRIRQLLCPQCSKEKKEHVEKFHIISNKPTGTALIKIQVI